MPVIEIKVPQFSESGDEATLLEWKKREGEIVHHDEILVELKMEIDKVKLGVPATASGTLVRLLKQTGGSVRAGESIAVVEISTGADNVQETLALKPKSQQSVPVPDM